MQKPKVNVEFIAYRKHSRLPKAEANRLQVRITEPSRKLLLVGLFPAPDGKPGGARRSPVIRKPRQVKSVEDAERDRQGAWEEWKIGMDPIENMVETLEDHAAAVLALDADERFDGHSAWATVLGDGERKVPVLVTNAGMSGDRQRFNLAHELGHLIIKQRSAKKMKIPPIVLPPRSLYRTKRPTKSLAGLEAVSNLMSCCMLKHKYGMSMQAWLRRAKDSGVISPSWYKNTVVIFRKRGWHRNEPGKQVASEKPIRFQAIRSSGNGGGHYFARACRGTLSRHCFD